MELPRQLRANRERLDMSQEDVAHAIYVSRQTISSWENSKTYPDVQSLLLLSQLFGVSIDELVKGDVATMEKAIENDEMLWQWKGQAGERSAPSWQESPAWWAGAISGLTLPSSRICHAAHLSV